VRTEQQALRVSLGAVIVVAVLGVVFGLVSGSVAIIFDGVMSIAVSTITLARPRTRCPADCRTASAWGSGTSSRWSSP
jgi:uncharacterized membrane protein YkgB